MTNWPISAPLAGCESKLQGAKMTISATQHLDKIRDRVGELQARADQVNYLAITMKSHLVPEVESSAVANPAAQECLTSIHVLLGLVEDLSGQLTADATAIGAAESELRGKACAMCMPESGLRAAG